MRRVEVDGQVWQGLCKRWQEGQQLVLLCIDLPQLTNDGKPAFSDRHFCGKYGLALKNEKKHIHLNAA
jgi:hypothetical protein